MFRVAILICCVLPSVSLAGGIGGNFGRLSVMATTGQSYQGGAVNTTSLAAAGYTVTTADRGDKRDTSSRIGMAYHFTPRWSAELGWIDLGSNDMSINLTSTGKTTAQIANDVIAATPRRGSGNSYTFGVNYYQPVNSRFGLHAGVGVLSWNDEHKVVVSNNSIKSEIKSEADGTDPYWRVGVDVNVTPKVSLVGNLERYYLDKVVDRIDLGLSYRF